MIVLSNSYEHGKKEGRAMQDIQILSAAGEFSHAEPAAPVFRPSGPAEVLGNGKLFQMSGGGHGPYAFRAETGA